MTLHEAQLTHYPSNFGGTACVSLNISLIIYIVAFASPFWFTLEGSFHLGLWLACYKSSKEVESNNTTTEDILYEWKCIGAQTWISNTAPGFENDWLTGVEAILTTSLIFHVTSSVCVVYYVGSSSLEKYVSRAIVFSSFCLTFAIACFTLTTVIVCGVLVDQEDSAVYRADLSWSYFLALTSTCIDWLCAVLLMVEVVRSMSGISIIPNGATPSAQTNYRRFELQQSIASNLNTFQNEAHERENEAENETYT